MRPTSLLTQTTRYIQSNDLVYIGLIDMTGFNIPFYLTGRNKDERRELFTDIAIVTLFSFLLAPVKPFVLNKIFARKPFKGNTDFFRLSWHQLDSLTPPHYYKDSINAITQDLYHSRDTLKNRLENPHWFDRRILKTLRTSIDNIDKVVNELKTNPQIRDKIYPAKTKILAIDLFLAALTGASIGPLKNWVTKTIAKKDRFTGSQAYLPDEHYTKLIDNTTARKNSSKIQRLVNGFLVIAPTLMLLSVLKMTRKGRPSNNLTKRLAIKLRDGIDYKNSIYMTTGAILLGILSKNLNLVNYARDKYERLETALKWTFIIPVYFYGHKLYEGKLSKLADIVSNKYFNTARHTFYKVNQLDNLKLKANSLDDILAKTGHNSKSKAIKSLAISTFYATFIAHGLTLAAIISFMNLLTQKRIEKDLQNMRKHTKETPEISPFKKFTHLTTS